MKAAGKAASIRAHTNLPIAVGFGISDPAQARAVAVEAGGGVGAAPSSIKSPEPVTKIAAFVKTLADAVKTT